MFSNIPKLHTIIHFTEIQISLWWREKDIVPSYGTLHWSICLLIMFGCSLHSAFVDHHCGLNAVQGFQSLCMIFNLVTLA